MSLCMPTYQSVATKITIVMADRRSLHLEKVPSIIFQSIIINHSSKGYMKKVKDYDHLSCLLRYNNNNMVRDGYHMTT